MTLDGLLKKNPAIAGVARLMSGHPDYCVRFWDDGTVDVTLPAGTQLWKVAGEFPCPPCDGTTEGPGNPGAPNVKGTFRVCGRCSLRFFIHSYTKFGGST